MEIVRNGQKILLTEWELFQAYEEQKYLYLKRKRSGKYGRLSSKRDV